VPLAFIAAGVYTKPSPMCKERYSHKWKPKASTTPERIRKYGNQCGLSRRGSEQEQLFFYEYKLSPFVSGVFYGVESRPLLRIVGNRNFDGVI